ncbi:hypothetical protein AVEN_193629-1 [Araneus ventricosus]|uniref:Uncharacterized protein n=1 Tax=Araneus ventricosus TaxID=182803 RepID=A0A4Y2HEW2_ARAVE|nr:hypothetical protein AVEN_193629-1 [Araneus ventricosus]
MRRRRVKPACDRHISARLRQLGNVAKPGTFSDAGTNGNRWETAPRLRSPSYADEYTATAAADIAPSDYHLLQQLIWFLVGQDFPNDDDMQTVVAGRQLHDHARPHAPMSTQQLLQRLIREPILLPATTICSSS